MGDEQEGKGMNILDTNEEIYLYTDDDKIS